eukprot:m.103528 g.103528  ORF g.103528 m.103528 type:complete len:109 (-) comp9096_c6_seq4:2407-2733(-)
MDNTMLDVEVMEVINNLEENPHKQDEIIFHLPHSNHMDMKSSHHSPSTNKVDHSTKVDVREDIMMADIDRVGRDSCCHTFSFSLCLFYLFRNIMLQQCCVVHDPWLDR